MIKPFHLKLLHLLYFCKQITLCHILTAIFIIKYALVQNIHEYDDLLTCQLYLRTGQCYYGEKECPFPHSPDGLKTKFTGKGKRLQVFNDVEAGKYTYSLPDSPSTDEPPEGASRE